MTDQDQPDEDQLERAFEYYPRLRRVKEYVEEHIDEPITLKDAATVANLEPKYFSTLFKGKLGITFTEWIHDQRINAAKQLLRKGNMSISNVSRNVGYSSERTFFRAFKKRTGSSPSDYKRQSRI